MIREYKTIGCVAWAPNGDWIVSCSNKDKDFTARVWDVTTNSKTSLENQNATNSNTQMICALKKHKDKIEKLEFYSNEILVSIDLQKNIILWEITKSQNAKGETVYKGKDIRRIKTPSMYVEFTLTQDRFICRKSHPIPEIRIIKFFNIKRDLK
jgi:WD40 repeat protein